MRRTEGVNKHWRQSEGRGEQQEKGCGDIYEHIQSNCLAVQKIWEIKTAIFFCVLSLSRRTNQQQLKDSSGTGAAQAQATSSSAVDAAELTYIKWERKNKCCGYGSYRCQKIEHAP